MASKMAARSVDRIAINITVFGSVQGSAHLESVQVARNKPLNSPESILSQKHENQLKDTLGHIDEVSFLWDGMMVEREATPMGLGMEEGETLSIIPSALLHDQDTRDSLEQSGTLNVKRKSEHISVGLNVVVGEEEGGLPVLVDPSSSKWQEKELLANLKTALLPALNMTMAHDLEQGHSLMHRPDFSSVEEKLEADVYKTGDEGMKEIMKILQRYNHSATVLLNTNQSGNEDISIVTIRKPFGEPEHYDVQLEAGLRIALHDQLGDTLREFINHVDWYNRIEDIWYNRVTYTGILPNHKVYVGPPRNANVHDYLSSPPIVQLKGLRSNTTFGDLLYSWRHYAASGWQNAQMGDWVTYDNKRCEGNSLVSLTKNINSPIVNSLYFCLPVSSEFNKDRDLGQLLDFIEGDDKKEGKKKSKKKKKKNITAPNSSNLGQLKRDVLVEGREVINGENDFLKWLDTKGVDGWEHSCEHKTDLVDGQRNIDSNKTFHVTASTVWSWLEELELDCKNVFFNNLNKQVEDLDTTKEQMPSVYLFPPSKRFALCLDQGMEIVKKIQETEMLCRAVCGSTDLIEHIEVVLEIGHRSTLRTVHPQSWECAPTHDWEVWVKVPSGEPAEAFLEKVVFHLHETFPNPQRVVTNPPFLIQGSVYASYNIPIGIDLFFRTPKGSNLSHLFARNGPNGSSNLETLHETDTGLGKARVDYELTLQPFKRPNEEGYTEVLNMRRVEKMVFPTNDEDFKRRLLKGGAKVVKEQDVLQKLGAETTEFEISLPVEEDDRDIEQLVKFIENEGKKGEKKKGKKKKVKSRALPSQNDASESTQSEEGTHRLSTFRSLNCIDVKQQESPLGGVKLNKKENKESFNLKLNESSGPAKEVVVPDGATAFDSNKPEIPMTTEREEIKEVSVTDIPAPVMELQPLDGNAATAMEDERDHNAAVHEIIKQKEAELQEKRNYAQDIIETKGREMGNLISNIEDAEDQKTMKVKELVDIDNRLNELQTLRARLIKEAKDKDELMAKLSKKKEKLDVFITSTMNETKIGMATLEQELESLKLQLTKPTEEIQPPEAPSPLRQPNLQLLEFITSKIEAKEKELECPVCFEVASSPIYMCDELHLICSECRPKVSTCPVCREPYPGKARRHRYAEMAVEELAGLRRERANLLDS